MAAALRSIWRWEGGQRLYGIVFAIGSSLVVVFLCLEIESIWNILAKFGMWAEQIDR